MKSGANFQDRNRIEAMEAQGHDVDSISRVTQIDPAVVVKFMKNPETEDTSGLPQGLFLNDEGLIADAQGNIYEADEDGDFSIVE